MNNPLSCGQPNFRILSEKNRKEDEKSLLDFKSEFVTGGNPCSFPTKAYVINRQDREDRWIKFISINQILFENFEVQRWEATVTSHSIESVVDAIFDSFYRCIKESKEECIVIMEDDAYLAEGAIEKIKKAWRDLPLDWDVLIGNHYFFGSMKILSDNLSKPTGRASTANFLIVRKTIVPKIEENLNKRSIVSIRDFDHFITSELVPINNFTIWPMVSREFPSFSNHKGKDLSSFHKVREHAFKYLYIDQDSYYPSIEGW